MSSVLLASGYTSATITTPDAATTVKQEDPLLDFDKVEVKPEFAGGQKGLAMFIIKNIQYPVDARRQGIKGDVLVGFIIEKDGSLSNIKVIKGIGRSADEESLRVMKLCPKWKPGTQNNVPVRVSHSIPISFELSGR